MQFKTHKNLIVTALVGSTALWLVVIAEGYFADPVLLGTFLPLLLVPISLLCLSISVVYVVRLVFAKRDRRHIALAGIAIVALFIHPITPGLPSGLDAFKYRMSRFEQSEYVQLLNAAQAELQRRGLEYLSTDVGLKDQQDAFFASLVEAHPVLTVGPWQPFIGIHSKDISFYWGYSRTGAFSVTVFSDSLDRKCVAMPGSDARCLYDRVTLQYRT